MNDSEKILSELKEIREIMNKSSRFLSLSGLSGILIGIYALIGAFVAWKIVYSGPNSNWRDIYISDAIILLLIVCASVLILSLLTVLYLTARKAKLEKKPLWGPGSKLLLLNLAIPLISGGIFVVILASRGFYDIVSPSFLIFYGLSLVNASKYTRNEIMTLGLIEITLGLIAAIFPGYGLFLWAAGFGLLHIIYGFLYLQIEKKTQKPRK